MISFRKELVAHRCHREFYRITAIMRLQRSSFAVR